MLCDPSDEGIYTDCVYENNRPTAISFKIRVFNDGLTTAKNVQLKVTSFRLIRKKDKDHLDQAECNYSFLKLNWSYQDEREALKLPHETKMDIQSKSYEDCDFLFLFPNKREAKLGTEQSIVKLIDNAQCAFFIQISGDNIEASECVLSFEIDFDAKDQVIKNYTELQK